MDDAPIVLLARQPADQHGSVGFDGDAGGGVGADFGGEEDVVGGVFGAVDSLGGCCGGQGV